MLQLYLTGVGTGVEQLLPDVCEPARSGALVRRTWQSCSRSCRRRQRAAVAHGLRNTAGIERNGAAVVVYRDCGIALVVVNCTAMLGTIQCEVRVFYSQSPEAADCSPLMLQGAPEPIAKLRMQNKKWTCVRRTVRLLQMLRCR